MLMIEHLTYQSWLEEKKNKTKPPKELRVGFSGSELVPVQPSIAKAMEKRERQQAKLKAHNKRSKKSSKLGLKLVLDQEWNIGRRRLLRIC